MSPDALFTLIILLLMLVALVTELYAPDVTLFSALGVLLVGGVLTPAEALSGFSNKGLLTVASLFVVAYSAQSSGVLGIFASRLMGDGRGPRSSMLRMMIPVTSFSAFLNNTPIVAMFIPAVREWALQRNLSPSKFLIPLSYASIFGGVCTLIGTSTNLVVHGLLSKEFGVGFSMFELAWVGVPCAAVGFVYLVFFGYRSLPANKDLTEGMEESGRDYLLEMTVHGDSPVVNKKVEEAGLRNLQNLFLAEVVRGDQSLAPVRPTDVLEAGDRLVFTGQLSGIVQLQKIPGLVPSHDESFYREMRRKRRTGITEAVVSRSFPTLGQTIKESDFRSRYDAVVLAVHRNGERIDAKIGQIRLRPGDTLLMLTGQDFHKRWARSRDFYMISQPKQMPELNMRKTVISLGTLLLMVVMAATGVLDILEAAIAAVVVLLLTGAVSPVEARRSLEINVLVVIASALGISTALTKTGAAAFLGGHLLDLVGPFGPIGLLAAIYLLTSVLTEVITNNAAAALAFPIAIAAAMEAQVDPMPFAIAIAIAASASFATPIGYQTNLMVYGPGGYRFRDFLRVGLPMNFIFMVVALVVIPMVWKF